MATLMLAVVIGLGAPVEANTQFEPSRKTLDAIAEMAVDKAIDRGRTLARDNAQAIVTYGVAAVTAGTLFASLVGLVVRSLVMAFIRWLLRLRED